MAMAEVVKNVMVSATKAKPGALHMNTQEAVGLRNCLEAMRFTQLATPMRTDDNAVNGIMNNDAMKQKRSNAWMSASMIPLGQPRSVPSVLGRRQAQ